MADDAAEVEEITSICGGLCINIPTSSHIPYFVSISRIPYLRRFVKSQTADKSGALLLTSPSSKCGRFLRPVPARWTAHKSYGIIAKVRETVPLIHNITNYVTVNDVANILLACGLFRRIRPKCRCPCTHRVKHNCMSQGIRTFPCFAHGINRHRNQRKRFGAESPARGKKRDKRRGCRFVGQCDRSKPWICRTECRRNAAEHAACSSDFRHQGLSVAYHIRLFRNIQLCLTLWVQGHLHFGRIRRNSFWRKLSLP